MVDAESPKVLDRIRKLLALSKSPNANEAEAAASAAAELMRKHKLEEADITSETQDGSAITEIPLGAEGFMVSWRFALVSVVARSCFCEAVGLRVGDKRKVRLVGQKNDAEAALEIFRFAVSAIERLAQNEMSDPFVVLGVEDPQAYLDAFEKGAAVGVADRLKADAALFAKSSEKAMVVVRRSQDEIRQYMSAKFGKSNTVEGKSGASGKLSGDEASEMAYMRGYDKGSSLDVQEKKAGTEKLLSAVDKPDAPK